MVTGIRLRVFNLQGIDMKGILPGRVPPIQFATLKPAWMSYLLSGLLVALVSCGVVSIQRLVIKADHGAYSNPNSIIFLLPIALMTVLGGRGPGIATVVLSAISCLLIVVRSEQGIWIEFYSGVANVTSMTLGGLVVVAGLDGLRRATELQKETAIHARRIAAAFEDRLIPKLPTLIPGLRLAYYYEPALDEASVGGDFLDLFTTVDKDVVMVLGDVSGKGIEAATQVSSVKNMIRLALNSAKSKEIASAVTEINAAIASQKLLTGFATLFVGIYCPDSLTLTYVSCGHELALVYTPETSRIVELPATGMVLGAFEDAGFDAATCVLAPGDTFIVYTDGLSESGVHQGRMLGTDGLRRLLTESIAQGGAPERIARYIIDRTKAYSGGRLSDDACLLACSPQTTTPEHSPTSLQL